MVFMSRIATKEGDGTKSGELGEITNTIRRFGSDVHDTLSSLKERLQHIHENAEKEKLPITPDEQKKCNDIINESKKAKFGASVEMAVGATLGLATLGVAIYALYSANNPLLFLVAAGAMLLETLPTGHGMMRRHAEDEKIKSETNRLNEGVNKMNEIETVNARIKKLEAPKK